MGEFRRRTATNLRRTLQTHAEILTFACLHRSEKSAMRAKQPSCQRGFQGGLDPGFGWLWCWSWNGVRLSRLCLGGPGDCVDIYAVTISEKRRKFCQYKVANGPPWVMSNDFRMRARVCIYRHYPHPKYISGLFQGEGSGQGLTNHTILSVYGLTCMCFLFGLYRIDF